MIFVRKKSVEKMAGTGIRFQREVLSLFHCRTNSVGSSFLDRTSLIKNVCKPLKSAILYFLMLFFGPKSTTQHFENDAISVLNRYQYY